MRQERPQYLPPTEPTVRADGVRQYAGVSYALVPGYRPLQLDLWVPPADHPPPLVVWIHGGAWLFGDRRYLPETLRHNQLFDALAAAGLAVATVDYRHAREAPFPAQLDDVLAAVRYLRLHADPLGVDVARVGVWGESAGGHLAALVGLAGEADAVVDWYGVADPETIPRLPLPAADHPPDLLLVGAGAATRDAATPLRRVRPGAPPFLLVHGTADRVVPFAQSETLRDALAAVGTPVDLVPVEGADHIFAGSTEIDAVVGRSVSFLRGALLTRGA